MEDTVYDSDHVAGLLVLIFNTLPASLLLPAESTVQHKRFSKILDPIGWANGGTNNTLYYHHVLRNSSDTFPAGMR